MCSFARRLHPDAAPSRRPGQGASWQSVLKHRVLRSVAGCQGSVVVHTGSWRHDLDQARCLPTQEGVKVQVCSRLFVCWTIDSCCASEAVGCVRCVCVWLVGGIAVELLPG